jgi:hypothetical protein
MALVDANRPAVRVEAASADALTGCMLPAARVLWETVNGRFRLYYVRTGR